MLVAFWEVQRLTREIHDLERQALEKQTELTKYEDYTGMLGASGSISMSNIAGLSSRLVPRATMFAQYSNQVSSMSAMQQLQQLMSMGLMPKFQNAFQQIFYQQGAFAQLKEQALKTLKDKEVKNFSKKEQEIKLELNHIEQKISEKRALLESSKKLLQEQTRDSAPSFGL